MRFSSPHILSSTLEYSDDLNSILLFSFLRPKKLLSFHLHDKIYITFCEGRPGVGAFSFYHSYHIFMEKAL